MMRFSVVFRTDTRERFAAAVVETATGEVIAEFYDGSWAQLFCDSCNWKVKQ
jgi:hypothetical protein